MTYSPSGISMPSRSRTSSTLVCPSISQRVLSTRTIVRLLVLVELVVQVAHQRLQEVLDGEQPGHPAVLVDHDGDGPAVLAHVGQRLEHAERLGHEVGLAHLAGDLQRAGVGGVRAARRRRRRDPGRSVRKMSLTKRMPIRSSRSSCTTGKQLCPDVRTAWAMSSACTGMVR